MIKECRLQDAISFSEQRDAQKASNANDLLILCAKYALSSDEKWVYRKACTMMERLIVSTPSIIKQRRCGLLGQQWRELAISTDNYTEEQLYDKVKRLDEAYAQEKLTLEHIYNIDQPDDENIRESDPYEFPNHGEVFLVWSKIAQCVCGIQKMENIIKEEPGIEVETPKPFLPAEIPLPKHARVLPMEKKHGAHYYKDFA